jgi:surfeit locus 1 family protein
MLQRLRDTRLIGPTIMTAIGLSVLFSLGAWQMQRKAWKENLIATIAERTKAEPTDLLGTFTATHPPEHDAIGLEYTRVKVRGRFLHDKERYFYAPDPELGPGVNVTTPMEIAGSKTIVFVNRGYVPDSRRDPASRSASQPAGEVEIVGLIREQGVRGKFTPLNDVEKNLWYWRDIPALTASAFSDAKTSVLPLIVDQEASAKPGDGPKGGTTIVTLTNRHLEYAITWYGLAFTLAGIFAVFASGRLRAKNA